jgi:hypothetical protein
MNADTATTPLSNHVDYVVGFVLYPGMLASYIAKLAAPRLKGRGPEARRAAETCQEIARSQYPDPRQSVRYLRLAIWAAFRHNKGSEAAAAAAMLEADRLVVAWVNANC